MSIDLVNSNMRRIAKAVNFGIIYGISGYGLSENIGITPGEAKKFIDDYLNTYPGIQKYMDETIAGAHKDGYVSGVSISPDASRARSFPIAIFHISFLTLTLQG